jgi:hypothetical protein
MEAALIHRARIVTRAKGARNAQGEKELGEPAVSPWIAARLMERGAVTPERRRRPNSTESEVTAQYELLLAPLNLDGGAFVVSASTEFETDCPILGSPAVQAAGKPEKLNDGAEHIGWLVYANKPQDAA